MLKPTTDPNASDARRDVAPAPRRPAHRHHRPAAGEQQPHGRGHAAARRAIAAPGEPGIISAEEDVLDINYEHSGP